MYSGVASSSPSAASMRFCSSSTAGGQPEIQVSFDRFFYRIAMFPLVGGTGMAFMMNVVG